MCIQYVFKYLCRHEETYWSHCIQATEEQRRVQEPCQSSNTRHNPIIEKISCCCSRECCQDDLDEKEQLLEKSEESRSVVSSETDSGLVPGRKAKYNLIRAAKQHFLGCLSHVSVDSSYHLTLNGKWIKCKQPLQGPRPLRIPDRPGIDQSNRDDFFAAVALWKKRPAVFADRHSHRARILAEAAPQPLWLRGTMSEEKLNKLRVLLSDMIWEGNFTWDAGQNFQTLLDIQDQVVALQTIGE